jgi:nitrate/TMAO reductase-like tetraheme cytochrome c subunit
MRRLLAFPSEALRHLGLLIAFVLIVAANGFAASHPVLTSVLVFLFSLPYLAASLVTKRASFLYATMLLGAASYFMACYALGAPGASFPLLSVPLVVCLWIVGYRLSKRLPPELAAYPSTVYRAMNITVAVFALWALVQAPGLVGKAGFLGYVPGLTYLCYACLYLVFCISGAWFLYIYVFAIFAAGGCVLAIAATGSTAFPWLGAMAAAAATLYVGTRLHSGRKYPWSRHFYFSAGFAIVLALALSLLRVRFFLPALATASLISWVAYVWFSSFAVDVRHAVMAERVVAKVFFIASLALAMPVVPAAFLLPAHIHVVSAALLCGFTLSWIAWQRRDQLSSWEITYVLAASFFFSAGFVGLGTQLSGPARRGWLIIMPAALIAAALLLQRVFDETKHRVVPSGLVAGAVFPVLLAWFVPITQGEPATALASATVALLAVIAAASIRTSRYYLAAGPGLAGVLVSGAALWLQPNPAWIVCAGAAAIAGVGSVWAARRHSGTPRASAGLAWLILSVAAVSMAVRAGDAQPMYALTVVAAVGVLLTLGRGRAQAGRDAFEFATDAVACLSTVGAVVVGPLIAADAVTGGCCLLALSAAYWLAWGWGRWPGHVYGATGLFSLGWLLIILGTLPAADARLAAGALLVLALLAFGAITRRSFPQASKSAVVFAHLTGIALASCCLIQASPKGTWRIALAAVPYVVTYAVIPRLREDAGNRVGTVLWLSFAVLFSLSAYAGTPYWQQATLLALLSVVWLAVAWAVGQTVAKAWSLPMYICAGVLAAFCAAVKLFAPAVEWSWVVFLINGLVFASLFLVFKHDVFAYLLTLSLSLMAYDWIKASANLFTQDVFFYLIIGSAGLCALFALPYLRKLVSRWGTVPAFSIYTLRGTALLAIPAAGFGLLLVSAYSLKVTGHPRFCTSCHNMADYYDSWQHSSHRDVACIECHYEPGVENEFKGKLAGIVQVVKYMSHSYDNKPHAMISNESCMREGCHKDMDHSKEVLLFRDKIRFRHDRHLAERPRGRVLNCVSCHGQTVQGQHISVTETTCLTCHFYGRGKEPVAAGQCLTCHNMPEKTVTFMGQAFNHGEFLKDKQGVKCVYCHSQVTQGDGAISPTRCRSCHLHELADVGDPDKFHLVHVSKGHFDCLQCHDEIKHGVRPMEQQLLATGDCETCHEGQRHSLQEKIYAGTALTSLETSPDAMYKAGVACGGCHTDAQISGLGAIPFTKKLSGARQCADCHGGTRYGQMLEAWQEDTRDRAADLQKTITRLQESLGSEPAAAEPGAAGALLASARHKLLIVTEDGSFGAHNYAYISEILDSAQKEVSKCLAMIPPKDPPQEKESE